jgi:hypothetical protein
VLNRVDVMPALLTAIGVLDAMNARALRRAQLTEGIGGALSCTGPLCTSGAKCQDGDPLSVRYDELPLLTHTARQIVADVERIVSQLSTDAA